MIAWPPYCKVNLVFKLGSDSEFIIPFMSSLSDVTPSYYATTFNEI
jgi:hypothetical protein